MWECLNHPWIFLCGVGDAGLPQESRINMDSLRSCWAGKGWKCSMRVVLLSGHLSRAGLRGGWLQLVGGPPHHGLRGRVQQAGPLSLGGN